MIRGYRSKSQTNKIISGLIVIALLLSLVSPINFATEAEDEELEEVVPVVEEPIAQEPKVEEAPPVEATEAEKPPEAEETPIETPPAEEEEEEVEEVERETEEKLEEEPKAEVEEDEEDEEVEEDELASEDDEEVEEDEEEEKPDLGGGTIQVKNYFNATDLSTNSYYSVVGVYVSNNNNVHLIIDNNKSADESDKVYNPVLNGLSAVGSGLAEEIGDHVYLSFQDGKSSQINGSRMFDINLGPMIASLKDSNTFQISSEEIGAVGMKFTINPGLSISKDVDKSIAANGDELVYTITLSNNGSYRLSGINVYDAIPEEVTVEDADGQIVLDKGLALDAGESKAYEVKAVVNEDVEDGIVIQNLAFIDGSILAQEDTADVTVGHTDEELNEEEEQDESEIDDSDINEDELEEEMMEIAPFAGIGDTFPQVKNYFEAIGNSTNDHYSVVGVYIASNDDVHLILDNDKNTANQVRFHSPMLNGSGAAGFGLNFGNYESYWDEIGTSLTLNFSDGSTNVITGVRLFDFNLGPMTENLQETNSLQMLNQADGFSIRGMSFTLNLDYQIDKKVNGLDAITSSPGEEVIYTVTVSNSGQYLLSGINVFDDVPLGLTILEVSTDNVNWSNANFNSSGDIILDSGLTLAVGGSKTYYVKALVNEDVDHGDIITNTAYVNGSVPRKEANASITVENSTIDLTIKKFVSGNFGDLSQAFPFIVTLDNGDAYNFELSDGQSKTLEEIPENSILTLKEDVSGYEVTLVVDGDEVLSNPDGSYTISVAHMEDATIEVTNHKDVDINTGISLDSMPYLMLLAVAVISLGVKIVHKGRIKD